MIYYTEQGEYPIFYNNIKWNITFKKCEKHLQQYNIV